MSHEARLRCGLALGTGLLVALLLWAEPRAEPDLALPPVPPVPREERDLAIGCLAAGEARPPLAELSDAELESEVEIVARLIGAYQRADFGSFLALRAGDLGFASRIQERALAELRGYCRELGVREEDLHGGWLPVLERFWHAYYTVAPVARFLPEKSRVELHREGLRGRSQADWELGFEALCPARRAIWHERMIPHRRTLAQVAGGAGPLEWLDLELDFETHAGSSGRLVARFVRDAVAGEWFLYRAVSSGIGGASLDRQLIL